jgi:hypothetical protein
LVAEDHLELTVTLGSDAVRDFLSRAELPAELLNPLLPVPPNVPTILPVTVAGRMAELTVGDKPVSANSLKVITEGLDTHLVATYPRPRAGMLRLTARYFNGIEPMRRGSFTAFDSDSQSLGSAVISRTSDAAEVSLPPLSFAEPGAQLETAVEPANPAAASAPVAGATVASAPQSVRGITAGLMLLGLLLVPALVWAYLRYRRCAST